jgi:hypothetical protein
MRLPDQWFFVTAGAALGLFGLAFTLSPDLRRSISSGSQVRELIQFRERFRPENVGQSCPNYPLYRLAACARSMIISENRLHYASMTARIYYLATIAEVAHSAEEFARTRTHRVENRADLLEYLNEEMKAVLVQTGGNVDLAALDAPSQAVKKGENPEAALTRRYHANLVDLWIKNWRQDEKYLSANPGLGAVGPLHNRLTILRADRDELFSRLAIDFSRYEKHRMPASVAESSAE